MVVILRIFPTWIPARPLETPEQALAQVEQAKQAWLEAAREGGKPIPPPRYRPIIYQVAR